MLMMMMMMTIIMMTDCCFTSEKTVGDTEGAQEIG